MTSCAWLYTEDGIATLLPGCWPRVHDPDAECTCGEWSEESAREVINGLRAAITRERHENQTLRNLLRAHGIQNPTDSLYGRQDYTARRRRHLMHKTISAGGAGGQE